MTLHLSIVLWLPLAFGVLGMFVPPKLAGRVALVGALLVLAYTVVYLVDYNASRCGSPSWASTTSSASTG